MKKSTRPKIELRHIKYKQKYSGNLPVPAQIYLQVLGNGGRGSTPSVMLFTSSERYLFNCGESTQRICSEHRMKLARLENIFFTYKAWDNIGGVLGLALTVQDIGVPKLTIHGPPRVADFFNVAKQFAMTPDVSKEQRTYWDPSFSDNAMTVEYVPIFGSEIIEHPDSSCKVLEEDNNDKNEYDSDCTSDDMESSSDSISEEPEAKRPHLEKEVTKDVAIAFICKLHPKPGRLNLEKCLEFGVKQGPLLGKLKNGEDVTLEDGQIVKSADVVCAPDPEVIFIVVECPTEDFLDSLLFQEKFSPYQKSGQNDSLLELIVHFTPEKVLTSPHYQEWISRFNSNISHLIVNDHNRGPCIKGKYRLQSKLNLIHPDIFPLLPEQINQLPVNIQDDGFHSGLVRGSSLLKYHIRERLGYNREDYIMLDNKAVAKEVYEYPQAEGELTNLKNQLSNLNLPKIDKEYPEIVFLGTGSSYPSKERNVTSILLYTSEDCGILLDCGEGTFSQLINFYDKDKIDEVLRKISCVFISHAHCDHHLGLFSIIKERHKAFVNAGLEIPPLILLAPPFMRGWMTAFNSYSQVDSSVVRLFMLSSFVCRDLITTTTRHDNLCSQLNLKQFIAVPVKHCKHAFGVAITHNSGWKIVFSGDTMPCQTLVKAGKDCDLLIHEATMEEELIFEAEKKLHSTTAQAIDIGLQMNAQFIILTHFSQRYAKIPIFNEKYSDRVSFAFDNMRVRFSDFKALPLFIPALKTIFKEEYDRLQTVSQKKIFQNKLEQQMLNEQKQKATGTAANSS